MQLVNTREGLSRQGVLTEVAPGLSPISGEYDIIHIFNTVRIHESYLQFRAARRSKVPVVCTPIWHSVSHYKKFLQHRLKLPIVSVNIYAGLREAFYARRSGIPIYWPAVVAYGHLQRRLVTLVDAVLPNSRAELRLMERDVKASPKRAFIVPNGTDVACKCAVELDRNLVLCAGRIEPLKNQISVIRAFKSLGRRDLNLVFYGKATASHRSYFDAFRRELVPGWIEYGDQVSHNDLMSRYQSAAVVVLASFYETTGLAVLEGIVNGAKALITDNDCTREYFEGYASFCDPSSIGSIRSGLSEALARPAHDPAPLVRKYSWNEAARITRAAYENVIATRSVLAN